MSDQMRVNTSKALMPLAKVANTNMRRAASISGFSIRVLRILLKSDRLNLALLDGVVFFALPSNGLTWISPCFFACLQTTDIMIMYFDLMKPVLLIDNR